MRVPAAARRAWTDVLGCVDEVFSGASGDREWSLQGGTLLAMRWGHHRLSTDIDVLIAPTARVSLWEMADATALGALDRALEARGWTLKEERCNAWMRIYEHAGGGCKIDLFQSKPRPGHGARWELVEGERVHCLSSAQILTGKIRGRARSAPVRDLYDAAVAHRLEPGALARALDEVETSELLRVTKGWLQGAQRYAEEAMEAIAQARYEEVMKHPAEEAVMACARSWTPAYRAWKDEEGWRITGLSADGGERDVWREGQGEAPQGRAGAILERAMASGKERTIRDLHGKLVMTEVTRAAIRRLDEGGRATTRVQGDG